MSRVTVVPYDPRWPRECEREAASVAAALELNLIEIHHIGSTAIPGIHAKPVIDILAIVADLGALDAAAARMQAIGYQVMGEFGIPGRRYFRRDNPAGTRTHQVHAFERGSPHIERHLAFRDFLRAHPEAAQQYGQLKRDLAAAHPNDMEAYMDGKDGFIKQLEAQALEWRAQQPA